MHPLHTTHPRALATNSPPPPRPDYAALYYAQHLLEHVLVRVTSSFAAAGPPSPARPSPSAGHTAGGGGGGGEGGEGSDEGEEGFGDHSTDRGTEDLWAKKRAVEMSTAVPGAETVLTHTTHTALRHLLTLRPQEGKCVDPDAVYVPDPAHEAAAAAAAGAGAGAGGLQGLQGLQGLRATWEDMLHCALPSLAMQVRL